MRPGAPQRKIIGRRIRALDTKTAGEPQGRRPLIM